MLAVLAEAPQFHLQNEGLPSGHPRHPGRNLDMERSMGEGLQISSSRKPINPPMCFIPHLFECCSRICCGITSQPQYQLSQYHLVRSLRPFSLRPCKTIVICHLDMCDETGLCHYSLSLSVPLYFGSLQFTPLRWLIFGVCGSHICKICKRVAPLTSGPIHARDLDLSGDYLWTAKHPKNIPTTSQIYQAYGDW